MVNKITTPPTQNEVIDKINELVDDKQDAITSSNKLSASLVSGLATVATSGSYNDLSNKPTIPTVNNATLTIQKNGANVATFTANASSNVTANITVPTTTSSVTSGSTAALTSGGAYTALQSYQTTANLVTSVSSSSTDSQYPSAKLFYDTVGDIEAALHTINSGVAVNNYTLSWYGVSSFSSSFSQIDLKVDNTVVASKPVPTTETQIGEYSENSEVQFYVSSNSSSKYDYYLYVNGTNVGMITRNYTYTFTLTENTTIQIKDS